MFEPLINPPVDLDAPSTWVVVRGGDVLVVGAPPSAADASFLAPGAAFGLAEPFPGDSVLEEFPAFEPAHFLGLRHGVPVWAVAVDATTPVPAGLQAVPLRSLHALLDVEDWHLAGRGVQIMEWARTHRFCGRCGAPTKLVPGERAMGCEQCGLRAYPRLSPAVIMAVHRGDELLLAHGRLFPMPMYSTLAGFVEPGESLEDAVRREVREEVGVKVGEVTYIGSQPWPFPNSLMIGFFAEYESGDIVIDPVEIVDAQWFPIDGLPMIPTGVSIAHRLIRTYIEQRRA
jgi:NAD+ diphosphatase